LCGFVVLRADPRRLLTGPGDMLGNRSAPKAHKNRVTMSERAVLFFYKMCISMHLHLSLLLERKNSPKSKETRLIRAPTT
jgi:hypothetical protein